MISNLTSEQTSIFPSIGKKFTKLGLSTQPVNQPQAIKAINLVYQSAGLDQPKEIIFVKSPMVGSILAWQLFKFKDFLYPINYNNLGWLAFCYTFQQLGLTEETKPLAGLFAIAEECGLVWTFNNFCIVSERPISIVVNDQGKLHNLKGPAISWSDSYCQYYVNGNIVHPNIGERLILYLNNRKSSNQPKFSLEKELKRFQKLNFERDDHVNYQVYGQICNQVYNQIYNQVHNLVYEQVRHQIRSQVLNQISFQIWAQVRNQIYNQV